jgi:UDP-N-acetylmuramate--alanine ligase
MHIYFSGIGGAGIGPLALIAKEAGFEVSGSDKKNSSYIEYLSKNSIVAHIGQDDDSYIRKLHLEKPIDWYIYSSALPLENPKHPELMFTQVSNIKSTKRDEFLSYFIKLNNLKLIAVAGTHGKTTTTGMLIWLFKNLNISASYSIGAKTTFCEMGEYNERAEYFIYECDEFDRNFLSFYPYKSIIASVDWDHHEIYPTRENYKKAFRQFIEQSDTTYLYSKDIQYLNIPNNKDVVEVQDNNSQIDKITLNGLHNRKNATLCTKLVSDLSAVNTKEIIEIINQFPGTSRRFEKISNNVYTDYAHTPEEIEATIQLASEISDNVVAIYEPLTDRRQHFAKDGYKNVFSGAKKVYWLPSYLAREDPNDAIIKPADLIDGLSNREVVEVSLMGESLESKILEHINNGQLVVFLAGGGGGSLDDWAREKFSSN